MTFTPSNTSLTISVVIVDNGILEEGEFFVVQFNVDENKERVNVPGSDNATVTIVDDDSEHFIFQLCFLCYVCSRSGANKHYSPFAGGTVSLSSASYSVVEGGEVNVTIQLARVPGLGAVTVQLSTSDGTATGKSICNTWGNSCYLSHGTSINH